jgi:hypothetical protein
MVSLLSPSAARAAVPTVVNKHPRSNVQRDMTVIKKLAVNDTYHQAFMQGPMTAK